MEISIVTKRIDDLDAAISASDLPLRLSTFGVLNARLRELSDTLRAIEVPDVSALQRRLIWCNVALTARFGKFLAWREPDHDDEWFALIDSGELVFDAKQDRYVLVTGPTYFEEKYDHLQDRLEGIR